jgi:hypothetical protein
VRSPVRIQSGAPPDQGIAEIPECGAESAFDGLPGDDPAECEKLRNTEAGIQ